MKKPLLIIVLTSVFGLVLFGIYYKDEIYFRHVLGGQIDQLNLSDALEERITMINVGEGDRAYIAGILEKIAPCNPKLVFLDINFYEKKIYVWTMKNCQKPYYLSPLF